MSSFSLALSLPLSPVKHITPRPTHQGCGQVVAFLLEIFRHLITFLTLLRLVFTYYKELEFGLIFFTGHFS